MSILLRTRCKFLLPAFFLVSLLPACEQRPPADGEPAMAGKPGKQRVLKVSNPGAVSRSSALIEIGLDQAEPLSTLVAKDLSLVSAERQLATQWVDRDADGRPDHLIAVADMAADKTVAFRVLERVFAGEKKVQADFWQRGLDPEKPDALTRLTEAIVPASHTVGDRLYKYQGVGWESDKVAYRLYLDTRNVIDIFGKRTPELVLQGVGAGRSYHELQDWGMDVLKVGDSLGIGGIGALVNGAVERVEKIDTLAYREVDNGPVEATVEISQGGWQVGDARVDLTTRYRIHEGSRLTYVNARLSDSAPQLVTGIVKHPGVELLRSQAQGEWSYVATFGEQSLVPDMLGMAVFYRNGNFDRLTEDDHNYIVVFKAGVARLEYAFMAAWQMDSSAVESVGHFKSMLDQQLTELNQPLTSDWTH